MKGYVVNLEEETEKNDNFRKVLYTTKNSQLVIMNLKPGEDIGEEIHNLDQFIRVEEGEGKVILNDVEYLIGDGYGIVIPQGVKHNVINTSTEKSLKLYTLYMPPEHKDGVIHPTKNDALIDMTDEFDGKTTEE